MGCLEINEVSLIRKMSKVEWNLKSQSILVLKNRVQARQAILESMTKRIWNGHLRGDRDKLRLVKKFGVPSTGSR